MLSDRDIIDHVRVYAELGSGQLNISPFDLKQLQPASYDLRLSPFVRFMNGNRQGGIVDPFDKDTYPEYDEVNLYDDDPAASWLLPGAFALGASYEHVALGKGIAARVEGKSSLARLGLLIHLTAGFIDPGFVGNITLEILNVSTNPIKLHSYMPIAQIAFHKLESWSITGYVGKYQDSKGAVESRYHLNRPD